MKNIECDAINIMSVCARNLYFASENRFCLLNKIFSGHSDVLKGISMTG